MRDRPAAAQSHPVPVEVRQRVVAHAVAVEVKIRRTMRNGSRAVIA